MEIIALKLLQIYTQIRKFIAPEEFVVYVTHFIGYKNLILLLDKLQNFVL